MLSSRRRSNAFLVVTLLFLTFATAGYGADSHAVRPRLVGYLPGFHGNYADFAKSLDFSRMTHLNLAFGVPPVCNGACTAQSDMTFSVGQSDADIAALVNAAHAAGVKVILSIGGGGGDQRILQFYDVGLSAQLIASLDSYVNAHHLDGVDVDIEDPAHMGQPFADFVSILVPKMHSEHKIVTAAVAEYLQSSMPDSALHQFDFINVMTYSNLSDAQKAMKYYSVNKQIPADKITLGVPFFAQKDDGKIEENDSTVFQVYPNAWRTDCVSGGLLDNGATLNYVGEDTMAKETQLANQYGGIMIWELTQDAPAPHSLLQIIEKNLN